MSVANKRYRSFMINDILNCNQVPSKPTLPSPEDATRHATAAFLANYIQSKYQSPWMSQAPLTAPMLHSKPLTGIESNSLQTLFWQQLFLKRKMLLQSKPRKGGQIRFTHQQTLELEKRFQTQKYLAPSDRKRLAAKLVLSERQVKTWFQNRRAKWRRVRHAITSMAASKGAVKTEFVSKTDDEEEDEDEVLDVMCKTE